MRKGVVIFVLLLVIIIPLAMVVKGSTFHPRATPPAVEWAVSDGPNEKVIVEDITGDEFPEIIRGGGNNISAYFSNGTQLFNITFGSEITDFDVVDRDLVIGFSSGYLVRINSSSLAVEWNVSYTGVEQVIGYHYADGTWRVIIRCGTSYLRDIRAINGTEITNKLGVFNKMWKLDKKVTQTTMETVPIVTTRNMTPIVVSVNGSPNYALSVLWVERWEYDLPLIGFDWEKMFSDFTGNYSVPGIPVGVVSVNLTHPQPDIANGKIGDYAFAAVFPNGEVGAYKLYGESSDVVWTATTIESPTHLCRASYTDDNNDDVLVANATHVAFHESCNGSMLWLRDMGNITDVNVADIYNTPATEIVYLNNTELTAFDPIENEVVFSTTTFNANLSLAWFNKTIPDSPDVILYNLSVITRMVIPSIPVFSDFQVPDQLTGIATTIINVTITDMDKDINNASVKLEVYLANGTNLIIDYYNAEGNLTTTTYHFEFPALNDTTTAILRVRANDSDGYFKRTSNKSVFIDAQPPTILTLQKSPEQPAYDQSITITINATDNDNITDARINVPDRGVINVSMTREEEGPLDGGGVWVKFSSTIPAAFAPERIIDFYILVWDKAGNMLNYSDSYLSNSLPSIQEYNWTGNISGITNSSWIREDEAVDFYLKVNDPDNQTGVSAWLHINKNSSWVVYSMNRISFTGTMSVFHITINPPWNNGSIVMFYFHIEDSFNSTESSNATFRIDGSPPSVISITFDDTAPVNSTSGEVPAVGVGEYWGITLSTYDYGSGYYYSTVYYEYNYFDSTHDGPYRENFSTGITISRAGNKTGWCHVYLELHDHLGNARNYSYMILVDNIPVLNSHGSVEEYPGAAGFTVRVNGSDSNNDTITVILIYHFNGEPEASANGAIVNGSGTVDFALSTTGTRVFYYRVNMSDGYCWKIYGPYSFTVDGEAPTITKVDSPAKASYGRDIVIKLEIIDDHSGVSGVRIYYRLGGEWDYVNAIYSSGEWSGTIPAVGKKGTLEWKCEIWDNAGNKINSTVQEISLVSMPPRVTIEETPDWIYANERLHVVLDVNDPENESVLITVSVFYPDGSLAYTENYTSTDFYVDFAKFANRYGPYVIRINVTDASGNTVTKDFSLTVTKPPLPAWVYGIIAGVIGAIGAAVGTLLYRKWRKMKELELAEAKAREELKKQQVINLAKASGRKISFAELEKAVGMARSEITMVLMNALINGTLSGVIDHSDGVFINWTEADDSKLVKLIGKKGTGIDVLAKKFGLTESEMRAVIDNRISTGVLKVKYSWDKTKVLPK